VKTLLASILILSVMLLSGCSAAPAVPRDPIEISEAWVRLAPSGDMGANGALFMVIQNHGSAPDTLLRVESDAAHMVQVHMTEVDANGVASMHEVDGVQVPAGGSVEFKSGGYHVMLMGMAENVKEGGTAKFTLVFQHAGPIVIEAPVKAP
jgi:copper(I)-binding protein